jgi:4-alpha-glucanotransferase
MTLDQRASGILLHITSLPSDFGIGDLGFWSYYFADLLSESNQSYWSILPLTSTSPQYGNSPYQPTSAFAGNTLLISPELLFKDGLLTEENVETLKSLFGNVSYRAVKKKKEMMIKKSFQSFNQMSRDSTKISRIDYEIFCSENSHWLDDYTLFKAIEDTLEKPWYLWPNHLRDRNENELVRKKKELKKLIDKEKFAQFLFLKQWSSLKKYCHLKKIRFFGDLPFYVSYDSADVWSHPELFKLNDAKKPKYVSGVPPDYFSKNGQLWGNPTYDWHELKKTRFQWWVNRIQHNLKFCEVLRFDHFRGFTATWQIPASNKTAKKGRWIRSPSKSFFTVLKSFFPNLPFVAEDLGLITQNVVDNLASLGIPGMRVLIFAFNGESDNPNSPENHPENSVVYTGTHDTNTVKGWFLEEASYLEKNQFFKSIGKKVLQNQISYEFIKLALSSKAKLAIIPLQDLFSLGSEARMNYPAKSYCNWEWRVKSEQLKKKNFEKIKVLTISSGRLRGSISTER